MFVTARIRNYRATFVEAAMVNNTLMEITMILDNGVIDDVDSVTLINVD